MPIIKSSEPLPERQPVILIFGEPGTGKTSFGNTCQDPLEIDFDRGVDRSIFRKDTMQVNAWDEVLAEETAGTFRNYKTIVVDTAKAALDDYLMNYVVAQDYKLKTNKLGMYGAIGDQFKIFVNARRAEKAAIVIIAHAKKDEDSKKIIPDVTGQSYQLLLRIADQVGYMCIKNGKRVLSFEPSDFVVGKNVAGLPEIVIPDKTDPKYRTFGQYIVDTVRTSIASMSEEQQEALEKSGQYQEQIASCSIGELSDLLTVVGELPEYLKLPLVKQIGDRFAKELQNCKDVELFNQMFSDVNELPEALKSPLRKIASQVAKANNWTPNEQTKRFEAQPDEKAGQANGQANNQPAAAPTQQGSLIPEGNQPANGKSKKADKKEGTHA